VRWKLLIIASVLAALAGAGASLAALLVDFSYRLLPYWAGASIYLLPLAATTYASIFVYRRTSRRRALQAAATALLSLLLTLAAFVAVSFFFGQRTLDPDAPPPRPVAALF